MSFLDVRHYVKVEVVGEIDEVLSNGLQTIIFTQTTSNLLSNTTMTFLLRGLRGTTFIPTLVAKKIVKQKEIKFQFFDVNDKPCSLKHTHVISEYFDNFDGNDYSLTFKTEEKVKSDMRVADKSIARIGDRISDIVSDIMQESGFQGINVEDTVPSPDEWKKIIQPYITNYAFVLGECNPRAKSASGSGGYCLFSPDGMKGFWQTRGHKCKEKQPLEHQVLEVNPERNVLRSIEDGSITLTHSGFDVYKVEPIEKFKDHVVTPSYGVVPIPKGWDEGFRYVNVPYFSKDAIDASVHAQEYKSRYHAYPVTIQLKGDGGGWDELPYNFRVVNFHDQADFLVRGYVDQVTHVIDGGSYTIEIKLLRDLATTV